MQHLTAHVDECRVGSDRVRGDDHSLDQSVGGGHHQRNVLAGPRLGFVGIDHEVLGLGVVLRDEAPLHPRREASTAAAAQAGFLDKGDDFGRLHLQRSPQGVVAATPFVVGQLPGALVCPVRCKDRCQRIGHAPTPPRPVDLGCAQDLARPSHAVVRYADRGATDQLP